MPCGHDVKHGRNNCVRPGFSESKLNAIECFNELVFNKLVRFIGGGSESAHKLLYIDSKLVTLDTVWR